MEDTHKRIYLYDNLKFILILLVVIGHEIEPSIHKSTWLQATFIFIYAIHMPAFLFISGLFSKNTLSDSKRSREKIIYYFSLYILLKLFLLTTYTLLHKSYTFTTFRESGLPWFMFVLAAYYALTCFFRDIPLKYLLITSILIACISGYDRSIGDSFCISRVITYYPFFLMGYAWDYSKLAEYIKTKHTIRLIGIGSILLLFLLSYLKTNWIYQFRPLLTGKNPFIVLHKTLLFGNSAWKMAGLFRFVYYFIIMLCILGFIALVTNLSIPYISKAGKNTLAVYFFHRSVLSLLRSFSFFPQFLKGYQGLTLLIIHLVISLLIVLVLSLDIFSKPFIWLEKKIHF